MAWTIELKFGTGGTWTDYSNKINSKSLIIENTKYKDLVSVISKANFVVKDINLVD